MFRRATARRAVIKISRRARTLGGRHLWIAAAVAIGNVGCDPYVKVTGVVRESSGAPLAGVSVTLVTADRDPRSDTTASDGTFHVGLIGADPRRTYISFERDGFQRIEEIVGEEEQRMMDVKLLPK
jgi:hypothetical protein